MEYERSGVKTVNHTSLLNTLFLFIILPALGGAAERNSLADRIADGLLKKGFENVGVILEEDHVLVTYENRRHRYEINALKEVLALIISQVKEKRVITLIPQNRGIPLVAITIPVDADQPFFNGNVPIEKFAETIDASLDLEPVWRKFQRCQLANSSLNRFIIVVHPQFRAQFGNIDDPVQSQINLAPEMTTSLWKGMSFSAQLIIPLQNELGEEGNDPRPGLLTLNQTLRFPKNTHLSATVGYFTKNRYGIDIEITKHFANGRWLLGSKIGYTGYASYLNGIWYYSQIDALTTQFKAGYFFSRYDLSLSATYGKFLYHDTGWRWDVLRRFSEVDIGFFTSLTEISRNGGIKLSIPLFPAKHMSTGLIRITPAKKFSWEYFYREFPQAAIQYGTGNSIDDFSKGLDPFFIKHELGGF